MNKESAYTDFNDYGFEETKSLLHQRNAELERKNRELEQLTYVASHDLQEPLRTTTGFVEALRKQYKGKLDEHADRYMDYIAQSSERMKLLIKGLLDYSRIDRKAEVQPIDCNILLQEVLADLHTVIQENKAVIHAEELPIVHGFPAHLKQVFQNLVINGIKFKKAAADPILHIQAIRKKDCWEFSIQDNGIGINQHHLDRIFVIFQRLHSRSAYEGSGIGLAICHKVIGLHGGIIRVTSVEGEGSTFHFTIADNIVTSSVSTKKYDFFISHATEDKDDFVRPLAEALVKAGFKVWYDEHQLKIGDSLRKNIDSGLRDSRYGIVVLSLSFFRKNWPEYELNSLVAKEMNGSKVILPIWHKVTKDEVLSYSPSLADKVALNTTAFGIHDIVAQLKTHFG
jgi:hypothetical protein